MPSELSDRDSERAKKLLRELKQFHEELSLSASDVGLALLLCKASQRLIEDILNVTSGQREGGETAGEPGTDSGMETRPANEGGASGAEEGP